MLMKMKTLIWGESLRLKAFSSVFLEVGQCLLIADVGLMERAAQKRHTAFTESYPAPIISFHLFSCPPLRLPPSLMLSCHTGA